MEFAIKNRKNGLFESIIFSNNDIIQTISENEILLTTRLEDNDFGKYKTISDGNIVTKINLPHNLDVKLVSKHPFSYSIINDTHTFCKKEKIQDFLYEIDYGNIDYEYAKNFFDKQMIEVYDGMCSSLRNGNFYGRNLDWTFDNNVDFIVHTPKSKCRHSVLGVAGNAPNIVLGQVDKDSIDYNGYDMFKVLPFFLLDGINECGVFINSNVAPIEESNKLFDKNEIKASVEEKERLCSKMIPRFVLDNFSCASKAIEYIRDYVTVYFPNSTLKSNFQIHFLIGDRHNTFALEFVNGKTVSRKINKLTNFNVSYVNFNSDGKVNTPSDIKGNKVNYPTLKNNIAKYGAGLERWNLMVDNYHTTNTKNGMRNLLDLLMYSNTYKFTIMDKPWHSECSHERNDLWLKDGMPDSNDPKYFVTVDTEPKYFNEIEKIFTEVFNNKERGITSVWITTHSCIYDLSEKKLYVKVQEENKEYIFTL